MAFMIAENKQGRIANQDWRLAFFVLGPTPGKHFSLAPDRNCLLLLSYTDCVINVKWRGIK